MFIRLYDYIFRFYPCVVAAIKLQEQKLILLRVAVTTFTGPFPASRDVTLRGMTAQMFGLQPKALSKSALMVLPGSNPRTIMCLVFVV